MRDLSGKVMTVRGPIEPDQLGTTIMHEHLFFTFFKTVAPNDNTPATDLALWDQELTIDNLHLVHNLKPIPDTPIHVLLGLPKRPPGGYEMLC